MSASNYKKTVNKIEACLKDMEKFVEGYGPKGFVYRYGFLKSHGNEGALIAMFDANTEGELNRKIARMDAKFHEYTDSRVQREFCKKQKCWYATYVVCFPFDNDQISGTNDWQGFSPLF